MNNLKTEIRDSQAEEVKDLLDNDFVAPPTPNKPTRGRPRTRIDKDFRAVDIAPAENQVAELSKSEQKINFPADSLLTPRRVSGREDRLGRSRAAASRANNDKPIFTLSVAAEILHLHPRTLRIYEEHDLVVPTRTQTNRRRYSQNDIKKFQFIQYLTRERGVNLSGVTIILMLLEELRKSVPEPIRQIFPDYGESEGFPLM